MISRVLPLTTLPAGHDASGEYADGGQISAENDPRGGAVPRVRLPAPAGGPAA